MKLTREDGVSRFPETQPDDWTEHPSGALVHRDAVVGEDAKLEGPAMFRGGWFSGGWFSGGTFEGGAFSGGAFSGGWFSGGGFWGGWFKGGWFSGGTFWGGTFLGGTFLGGTFEGGTFLAGTFKGGTFKGAPLFLHGVLPWPVNTCGPLSVAIGCEHHTLTEWRKKLPAILRLYREQKRAKRVRAVLKICEQWFQDNPGVITGTQEMRNNGRRKE